VPFWFTGNVIGNDWRGRKPIASAAAHIVGVMVAINTVEHFDTHAQKARRLPLIDSGLHEPRGSRVPKRVGGPRSPAASQASRLS